MGKYILSKSDEKTSEKIKQSMKEGKTLQQIEDDLDWKENHERQISKKPSK